MDLPLKLKGEEFAISVWREDHRSGNRLSTSGEIAAMALIAAIAQAKDFASKRLLETYNDIWIDDDHPELSAEQFARNLKIVRIELLGEPEHATLYFDDGDMFSGHCVAVSCVDAVPAHAELLG